MNDAVKSMLLVLSAVAAGCSTVPEKNPALEQARSAYRSAASNPDVVANAPVQLDNAQRSLQQAEKLWTEGGELAAVEHQAYLAEQRAYIAQQTAKLAVAEQAIADIGAERDKVLLQARTAEAERAHGRAEAQTQEAELARQQAEAARQKATQQARSAQEAREIALMQAREAEAAQARVRELESQLQELKAQKTERGYVLTLGGDVLFDVGKADLKPGAGRALDNLARFLKENPERKTVIEGFTDSTGGDEYNQRLSERRAEAVKDALVARGIESHRIAAKGHGKAFPVATNDTVAGRQLNRRVEVVISEVGGKVGERQR